MKLDRTCRPRLAQALLAPSNLSAGRKTCDICRGLRGMPTSVLRLAGVIALAALASGASFAQDETTGFPEDWTHHHVVFSDPGTIENALIGGSYYNWRNVVTDPRFNIQRKKRSSAVKKLAEPDEFAGDGDHGRKDGWSGLDEVDHELKGDGPGLDGDDDPGGKIGGPGLDKDWTSGILTGTVQPNTFPAKWSFSTSTASCANDYVVYPTGSAGSTAKASILAFYNLYTGGCTGTVPSVYWAYDTGGTVSTSSVLSFDGAQVAFIQVTGTAATLVVLKGLQGPTPPAVVRVTTATGSTTVTITAGTVTTADVGLHITGGGIPANDSIASITGSPATSLTLATAATAIHANEALTVHAEAAATPVIPATATNAAYRACTAPCMTTLLLSGTHNDTFSSPFYLYGNDELYVGDDSGNLHKFTGIFNGTPAETTTSWPVVLNAANKATSPVYDFGTGYVLVGDTGGILYAVGSGNQGTTSGSIHGTSGALGGPIIDAPLVDSTAGMAYVFVTRNSGGNNAVFQFNTSFTTGTGNVAATGTTVLTGGTVAQQYYLSAGTFDNVYYQSAAHSGNLWVVGNTSAAGGGALYRINIAANVMAATSVSTVTLNSTHQPWPSPVTEFCNNGASACVSNGTNTTAGADYLFFSVNRGTRAGCTNANGSGCVLSYNVSTPATPAEAGSGLNVTDVGAPGCWATTGIVVDNSVATGTLAGASQIYFINFNGHTAGGPTGAATSVSCTSATTRALNAVQALQSSP